MPELDKLSVELESAAMLINSLTQARTYAEKRYTSGCISPMLMLEIINTAKSIIARFENYSLSTNVAELPF